jgi:hypothetical protein
LHLGRGTRFSISHLVAVVVVGCSLQGRFAKQAAGLSEKIATQEQALDQVQKEMASLAPQ